MLSIGWLGMLKYAYFSLIAGLAATPIHFLVGTVHTRIVWLGLLLLAAACGLIGLHRGP